MHKKILVIASHPDDEALGCGGTILNHVKKGDEVSLLLMTDGVSARSKVSKSDLKIRKKALKLAKSLLGIKSLYQLNLSDNAMDKYPLIYIVKKIETIIKKIKPTVIYTHHYGDLNIDHKVTHDAVMTACRPFPNSTVNEIYGFEVLSSTDWSNPHKSLFAPTFFVDIKGHIKNKINVLEAYFDELREPPHSRSIDHIKVLAKHRGYSMGVEMAEAFEVYRIIKR